MDNKLKLSVLQTPTVQQKGETKVKIPPEPQSLGNLLWNRSTEFRELEGGTCPSAPSPCPEGHRGSGHCFGVNPTNL